MIKMVPFLPRPMTTRMFVNLAVLTLVSFHTWRATSDWLYTRNLRTRGAQGGSLSCQLERKRKAKASLEIEGGSNSQSDISDFPRSGGTLAESLRFLLRLL
ncbi:hypothetical protein C8R46DRAFT_1052633 [Mycena filopes]|nr:hypothetical protein C8R46DRAFT_1052633 [Mycena filopes]